MRRIALVLLAAALAGPAVAQTCPQNVPHLTGTWKTLPYLMPINPISATLLHTGKVLIVAGSENDFDNHQNSGAESYRNAVWDLATGGIAVQNINYDVFCSGSVQLPHGRTMIVGGSSDYSFAGDRRASFFDPLTESFAQSQNMAAGRWYATATALGDGRIMAFSGLVTSSSTNNTVQLFDLANAGAGWGSAATAPFTPPLYPRQFLLPSGKVFFTGHGSGDSASNGWIFDPVPRTWAASVATTRNRSYGGCVLLPLVPPSYTPKVFCAGGVSPATRTTETIDLSVASPAWTGGPNMSTERIELNAVLLPNGRVLVSGGSLNNEVPDTLGKTADLYDAVGGVRSSGGTASYSRLYHSTALLLPDATVASMGSNPGDRGAYLPAIEIYTPPYLYDAADQQIVANRPAISNVAPAVLNYGATFTVDYASAAPIGSAVLVRPGSTTHAFDMEQRVIGLCGPAPQPACGGGAGTLTLTTPPNGNIAPPGFYMLFLLDTAGVPSRAAFVELTPFTAAPPDGAISSPAGNVTITAGGTVSFDTNTSASKYSWVFPGGTPSSSTAHTPGPITFSTAGVYVASLTLIDASDNSDPSPPTRKITVLPTSGNFDIAVTPTSRTVQPGQPATFTVTTTALSGFGGTIALSVSSEGGFLTGVTSGGFSPPSLTGSGSSTLTINTTTSAEPYALSLTVKGTSSTINHTAATSLLINLAQPAALQANATDSQVALSWQPVSGATSYRVNRSLAAGGPHETIGCTNVASYVDGGLANGTTYYYTVTAAFSTGRDGGGASAESAEVAATPPCPIPGYSGLLTAGKSAPEDALWSWTAGGAGAYDLVRGDLDALRASDGDFSTAVSGCLANDVAVTSLPDPNGAPAPGACEFLLLRPATTSCPAHGSYDGGGSAQVGGRDAGIQASPQNCP
ncbi:MAG TPA: galactose oxidase-like domain-containing protein [Candidatus Polarisedimenticolaceae bacterium]|nr:galactose oxidase-like domain-containing protein [Candidatus Polarisedimenticolaceae bacterium]